MLEGETPYIQYWPYYTLELAISNDVKNSERKKEKKKKAWVLSNRYNIMSDSIVGKNERKENTKYNLRWAALFLGELRDGLTMVCVPVVIYYITE